MTNRLGWFLLLTFVAARGVSVADNIQRIPFQNEKKDRYVIVEVLGEDVFHFVMGHGADLPNLRVALPSSPYIATKPEGTYAAGFSGPALSSFRVEVNSVKTSRLSVTVEQPALCLILKDVKNDRLLTRLCPMDLEKQWKGIAFSKQESRRFYGLGEQFLPDRFGSANGDWNGKVRYAGAQDDPTGQSYPEGNAMLSYYGGAVGNTQYPILYAKGKSNYSIFVDTPLKQRWNFTHDPVTMHTSAATLPFFFTLKDNLWDLRIAYMDLVGHPQVPPKKAFGLWVSEYGYTSWTEIRDRLAGLRAERIPVDGFMLDLQWFGGVTNQSEKSRMGTLTFDETHFPNPEGTITHFWKNEGIGFIPIEEAYISKDTDSYRALAPKGFLVKRQYGEKSTPKDNEENAFPIDENPWWGLGSMIDYFMEEAGDFWHAWKRMPLVLAGVVGHWTDLSEPEMYRTKKDLSLRPVYGSPKKKQLSQEEAQNIFALFWAKSIEKGYRDFDVKKRPFSLSRSGGSGIQRYGAAKWCGDIGSNFGSLATLYGVQLHLMFSGVDYYGGDVGGFHREALGKEESIEELYTQWLANAASFDVPVRPHTLNLEKRHKTSPAEIGDRPSNRANLRLRYALSPYYYSLAHRAYHYGEPLIPAVVLQYPDAPVDRSYWDVEQMGHEKLIGKDLLVGLVAQAKEKSRNIYLPPGEWIDFHTNEWHFSVGSTLENYPEVRADIFQLPLFARAGAILPKMYVDDKTLNILGKREDRKTHLELIARVYPSLKKTVFGLYEDDGTTIDYQEGKFAKTAIRQQQKGNQVIVTLEPTEGTFDFEDPNTGNRRNFPTSRDYIIELVRPSQLKGSLTVRVDGQRLDSHPDRTSWEKASDGFYLEENGAVVVAKSGEKPCDKRKIFEFQLDPSL